MADKEEKKGKINNYNGISITQKDYYYDRDTTDADLQKAFGDMLSGLKDVNIKLKKELKNEKPVKLELDK